MQTVSVNGVQIPERLISEEAQNHPAESGKAAREEAARALVIRELLLQEAGRVGIEPRPRTDGEGRRETDEEAAIRELLERELRVPDADEPSCRRYYENNLKRFRSPDLFEAAHILLACSPDDKAEYARAAEEAETIIADVTESPHAFARIAEARSACPSGRSGGTLGQFSRGRTVPEFETFLVALEPGQVCPVPVKTRYGVHVLRLDRIIQGQQLPFKAVKDRIGAWLQEASWRKAATQYVAILAGRAKIDGVGIARADGPLVQ
ncbi:MAG: peptidylprolyl isomerase [Pseudomonadota bacterium]|nr:peptidylprolyl isomerase [Pseudomonadota bacterium]